jgi:hypothetical protein
MRGEFMNQMSFSETLKYIYSLWRIFGSLIHISIHFPLELREKLKEKNEMTKFTNEVIETLKQEGFLKGYYHWHFSEGKSRVWYPILHIITPGDCSVPKKPEEVRRVFSRKWGIEVMHYVCFRTFSKVRDLAITVWKPTWHLQTEVDFRGWEDFRVCGVWDANEEEVRNE